MIKTHLVNVILLSAGEICGCNRFAYKIYIFIGKILNIHMCVLESIKNTCKFQVETNKCSDW